MGWPINVLETKKCQSRKRRRAAPRDSGEAIGAFLVHEQEQDPHRRGQHHSNKSWLGQNQQRGTSVDPIHSAYMPDRRSVIGIVESVRNNLWFADVNGPFNDFYQCHLHLGRLSWGSQRTHGCWRCYASSCQRG